MKELSSSLTFFYKYIILVLWIVGFGIGGRDVIFASEAYDLRWIQYMVTWLMIGSFFFFITGPIKKVVLEGRILIVSNYLRTEKIDIEQITAVDSFSFFTPKLVWFTLRDQSPFGKKIVFLPKHRIGSGLGKHPLVFEMRRQLNL
ncbi:MAG: hypothetical protein V2I36_04045 [Desulfopila sp.]|jgi:hypothetical protein|nr:hypothetical protein [Desulfopila sp.]